MADEDKQSGTNLTSVGIALVVLATMGGTYFFHKEPPIVSSRPAIIEEAMPEQGNSHQHKVTARRWQDPFAAVAKSLGKVGELILEQQCLKKLNNDGVCSSPLEENDNGTLVLGVTVSGAPYQEDAEHRRRTRYAVQAGLERMGFTPRDANHINFFLWDQDVQTHNLAPIAVDIPADVWPLLSWWRPTVDDSSPSISLQLMPVVPATLLATQAKSERNEIAAIAQAQQFVVPYEWFEKTPRDERAPQTKILVLWLSEDSLTDRPLRKISQLKAFLQGSKIQRDLLIKIVGPSSSDMLKDMVSEAASFIDRASCQAILQLKLKNVRFYAYGASASDELLLGDFQICKTVQEYFSALGIPLIRTVSTDDAIAHGIRDELRLRRVDPSPDGQDNVLLIAESDTFYGQALLGSLRLEFARDDLEHPWIHEFTYFRGLDGELPFAGAEEGPPRFKASSEVGTTDLFKPQTDTKDLDLPMGRSQVDYLRRVREQLVSIDKELRSGVDQGSYRRRIKAIGILGSDVFDKLLVLRALRPKFPGAIFFTTDFDEIYTQESELPWTRNLIISSSFGPSLNANYQRPIAPFRDNYQTSAFLATQLAIGDFSSGSTAPDRENIAAQLQTPRIFEIERTGDVRSIAGSFSQYSPRERVRLSSCFQSEDSAYCDDPRPPVEAPFPTVAGPVREGRSLRSYRDDFRPPIEPPFPTFHKAARLQLSRILAFGALGVLTLLISRKVRQKALIEVFLVVLGLAQAAMICFYWEPWAQLLTEYGDGEPITLLQGVSVWPTVLLRNLGTVLAAYLIFRAQRNLRNNLAEIARAMELEPISSPVKQSLGKKIAGLFDFSLRTSHYPILEPLQVEPLWQKYVRQERLFARFFRAALYSISMWMFLVYVVVPLIGGGGPFPVRGELAWVAYVTTSNQELIITLFLTFLIFDATVSCLLFVATLRDVPTAWPPKTLEAYKERLGLQTDHVNDWIDLEFVAKRTRCVANLIYYPLGLIALFILGGSTVFANYAPSLTALVGQGISFIMVLGCAIFLWRASEALRTTARENLTDAINLRKIECAGAEYAVNDVERKAFRDKLRSVAQLETLLSKVDQLSEGAFGSFSQQPLVKAVLLPMGSIAAPLLIDLAEHLIKNGMVSGH